MQLSFDGLKVMVVDDSKIVRHAIKALLESAGCEVSTAKNGFEALAKVAEFRPKLIFMDIMMPRLDGYQTCAIIKNQADFCDTHIVMLSVRNGIGDKARAHIVGANGFLSKPFSQTELFETITQYRLEAELP